MEVLRPLLTIWRCGFYGRKAELVEQDTTASAVEILEEMNLSAAQLQVEMDLCSNK